MADNLFRSDENTVEPTFSLAEVRFFTEALKACWEFREDPAAIQKIVFAAIAPSAPITESELAWGRAQIERSINERTINEKPPNQPQPTITPDILYASRNACAEYQEFIDKPAVITQRTSDEYVEAWNPLSEALTLLSLVMKRNES